MGRRRREGTCDLGQVRVGTRFALDEDEVSYHLAHPRETQALWSQATTQEKIHRHAVLVR